MSHSSPTTTSSPLLTPIWSALLFGLAVGGIDLLVNLYHRPPGLEWPAYALLPALSGAGLGAALFLGAWGLLRALTGKLRRGETSGATGLGLALGVLLLALEWGEATPYFYSRFLMLLFPANLAVGVTGHVLWTLTRREPRRLRGVLLPATVAAYLAAMAHLGGWLYMTRIEATWDYQTAQQVERILNRVGFGIFGFGLCVVSVLLAERLASLSWPRQIDSRIVAMAPFLIPGAGLLLWRSVYGDQAEFPADASPFISLFVLIGAFAIIAALIRPTIATVRIPVALTLGLITFAGVTGNREALSDAIGLRSYIAPDRDLRHIILITSDALRSDALEIYGGEEIETPHLKTFAGEAVVFDEAISAASWTLPAFAGMFSGFPPGVFDEIGVYWRMPDAVHSLAERLESEGYYTGAIGMNPLLRPRHGLNQGFRTYDFYPRPRSPRTLGARLISVFFPSFYEPDRNSEALKDLTVEWIEQNRDRDFFLWLHFWDPHTPLGPPPPYRLPGEGPPSIVEPWERSMEIKKGLYDPRPAEREWLRKLYLGEVRYVDAMFGQLIERLKALGIYEDALIIFSSDHGEEFWDHGAFGHGQSLFHELIHVPLVIKPGGEPKPGRVPDPVWTVSLTPTILDLADVAYDANDFSAPSLAPVLKQKPEAIDTLPIYSETSPDAFARHRWSVRFGRYTYMQGPEEEEPKEELYDLERDPEQMTDIATEKREAKITGREHLERYHESNASMRQHHEIGSTEALELPGEDIDRLKNLGYL